MSKEEQIALELTRITGATTSGCQCTIDNYKAYLKELQDIKEENSDIAKLQDEIGTYKYVINAIKELIERDENNFVLKEDLLEKIGGLL